MPQANYLYIANNLPNLIQIESKHNLHAIALKFNLKSNIALFCNKLSQNEFKSNWDNIALKFIKMSQNIDQILTKLMKSGTKIKIMDLGAINEKLIIKSWKFNEIFLWFENQFWTKFDNKIQPFSMKFNENLAKNSEKINYFWLKFLTKICTTPWLKFIENQLKLIIKSWKINEIFVKNWEKISYFSMKSWPNSSSNWPEFLLKSDTKIFML